MKAMLYSILRAAFVGVFALFWSLNAQAQDRRVTGSVTGTDGALPGANIVLKGTSTGTTTDADGNFSLNIRGANPVLVISAIGFKRQEVTLGNRTSINVALEDDATSLNEVIVTGYTTDDRRTVTGAVSTVKTKDLAITPTGNVEQTLQGRVAGVTVITNGQPGTNSLVRIRGFGSFGGNQPLYVVDGVPISDQFNGINFLSPDDIASTTVLKDASTASIYGARAAGGVIVITTKQGLRNAKRLTVSYDGLYGITTPGKGQPILNPQQQADWTWQARKNDIYQGTYKTNDFNGLAGGQYGNGPTPVLPDYLNVGGLAGVSAGSINLAAEQAKYNVNPANGAIYQIVAANKQGTDWYGAITRNAPISRQTIGISGGGDRSRFYIGLSAQNQAGILKYNNFNRYTFRVNTEFDILKNLRLGENLQFTYRQILGQLDSGTQGQNLVQGENDILTAFRAPPIIPIYDINGNYAGTAAKGFNNPQNPVASRDLQRDNRSFNGNGFGNIYLEYDPIPGLTLRSSIGGQFNAGFYKFYSPPTYWNAENVGSYTYGQGSGYSFNWTVTNTANYKRTFGMHTIDVLAGQEALNTGTGTNIDGSGLNPFSTDPNFVNLSTTQSAGRQVNSGYGTGVNFYSLFGRAVYTFNDKYTITGVLRRDGSSRFGAANRYGVFPAVSAGWTISNEQFLKNVPVVSYLRLHAGYGTMGNSNNVDPNNQYSLYTTSPGRSYDITGSKTGVASGIAPSRIGNPNAKWETAVTSDIGLDASFLNGRLNLQFDVWRKDTRDLLFQVPLPGVVGTNATAPAVNIASMRNQGIDIQIGTNGSVNSALRYEVVLNGSFLSNTVQSLAPGINEQFFGNFRGLVPVRIAPGFPISSFYGYKVTGLFQSKEEVAAAPTQDGAAPGRFRYADVNGDGKIDASDRTFLGSPVPKFTGGLNFTLRYKGFDVSAYMYTSLGGKIFNASRWYQDFYPSFTGAAVSARVLNSWLPTNTNTNIPIFENTSNFSTNTVANSYYVESGNYLRMQNITIGYTLPAVSLNRFRLQRLRLFLQTTNVFTITKYTGLDPAVGGAADTNFGIDVGNYPVTRGFNGGIGLTF